MKGIPSMTNTRISQSINRRAALAGLGAGGLGLALAAAPRLVAAQDIDMASHPLVGSWLAGRAPNDLTVAIWSADGSMKGNGPTAAKDANGVTAFSDPPSGSWVPVSARG